MEEPSDLSNLSYLHQIFVVQSFCFFILVFLKPHFFKKKWGTHNGSWCKLWNIRKFLNMKIGQVKLLLHSAVTTPHVINNHVRNVIPCQSLQLYKR